jgi:hypothetical protein
MKKSPAENSIKILNPVLEIICKTKGKQKLKEIL